MCRNKLWLDISVNYTESRETPLPFAGIHVRIGLTQCKVFRTIVILRLFPTWTHAVLRYLLPSYWNGQRYVRSAKSLLGPIIQSLIDQNNKGTWSPTDREEDSNVLCWLVETAKGRDRDAETLAHVEVLLALASVHTTLLQMVNVLYDVTANPRYISEIQDEIKATATDQWAYSSYARLDKLDSIMLESQRMSPPTILGLKRVFKRDFTFSDGTHVTKGAYVTMAIHAIENDPSITQDPSYFDGLRGYRSRVNGNSPQFKSFTGSSGGESKGKNNMFSSFTSTVLNFGYGKTACPGRYFASLAVKMTLTKLLCDYDFRFEGQMSRPKNLVVHEFLFCWPWQWMKVKKKRQGTCPF